MIYLMNHATFSHAAITESQRTVKLDLLYFAGVITTVPLLLFAGAAVRLPLTTIALLQYITPTFQFLCGVVVYGEAFHAMQGVAFTIIWIALGIYSFEAWMRNSAKPQALSQAILRN
jgi:chloramphenicol-sensitive protein RarD